MNLQGVPVLVIGAARSGISAARFLAQRGARPVLTDNKTAEELDINSELLKKSNIELSLGNCPEIYPESFHMAVVSPGVPLWASPVIKAEEAGVPVIGELELAWRFVNSPVVAITGTNGKTTTTVLTGQVFKDAGYKTFVAGNIGIPFIDIVEEVDPESVVVLEVSSFQLETTAFFRPRVGVVLNLTPDHLDRHVSIEEYARCKARIFDSQSKNDTAVLNYDDPLVYKMRQQAPGEVIFFSRKHILEKGVFVEDGKVFARLSTGKSMFIMNASAVSIPGSHNLENALAVIACGLAVGVRSEMLASTLSEFSGVSHRLELAAEINKVKYVNDSKGTNPEASIKALQAYNEPVVLIAGGRNKGNDFSELAVQINKKARVVIVLGESAQEIKGAVEKQGNTRILKADDLKHAVILAHEEARTGEIVLMSPACASWDMFNDYEERGEYFKNIVKSLGG
ncbi:MAG: UDP-N-acetylmuramoyl-L-alanine--D-glutamate ligase [Clostridiales bacterium]|nr:UDP-N-acetylmuramoyl-L-alanine--D-glutamate ligase [Clostridiales bacterium]MCF8021363.1 UDP-N-acetylmuramoyl-L-alanine--D-glutamate ligase [Clostridiales bacterium]